MIIGLEFERVNDTLEVHISAKVKQSIIVLQYADDNAIVAHADLPTYVPCMIT